MTVRPLWSLDLRIPDAWSMESPTSVERSIASRFDMIPLGR